MSGNGEPSSCGEGSISPSRPRRSERGASRRHPRGARPRRRARPPLFRQGEIHEAVGVVEGRAEHLSARQVLEGRGDAPPQRHGPGIEGLGGSEARQRRAEGPHEEYRLHHVAPRLLERQGCKIGIVERPLGHHPVHQQGHLLADLRDGQFRHGRIAPAHLREEPVGIVDGGLAALHGHVHRLKPPGRSSAAARRGGRAR